MTLHVFADESKKRGFILAAAIVDQGDLKELRATVAGLRLPRQRRLHFAKESDGRRSVIIRTFAQANLLVNIYNAAGFRQDKLGRDAAIARLADDAVSMGAARLVLELDDSVLQSDRRIIGERLAKNNGHDLRYEHQRAYEEGLLAIPDAVAWCWAKGGNWRKAAEDIVAEVVTL
jgi:hypothetical protein